MIDFKSFDLSKVKNTFKFIVKHTLEILKKIAIVSSGSINDIRSIFLTQKNKSKDKDLKKKIVNNLKHLKLLKKTTKIFFIAISIIFSLLTIIFSSDSHSEPFIYDENNRVIGEKFRADSVRYYWDCKGTVDQDVLENSFDLLVRFSKIEQSFPPINISKCRVEQAKGALYVKQIRFFTNAVNNELIVGFNRDKNGELLYELNFYYKLRPINDNLNTYCVRLSDMKSIERECDYWKD